MWHDIGFSPWQQKPDIVLETAKNAIKSWCDARCSKANEEELIFKATDVDK